MNIEFSQGLRRRRRFSSVLVVGAVTVLALAGCGSKTESDAGSGGEWTPNKDIEWIVPYSPGGGFDVYSRGIVETMQKTHKVPDGVNVVIRNSPPLPQGITATYTAKADGYTVAILPMPAAAALQIQDPDLAKWDTEKFTVLGSVDENAYVVYVAANSPYKTIEDLIAKKGLRSLTVEEGSSSALAGQAAIKALGLDANVTYGAEGSADVVTGLLRGDADFIVYGSTDLAGFVESGDIKPLLFLGTEDQRPESLTWLKDVPSAESKGFADLSRRGDRTAPTRGAAGGSRECGHLPARRGLLHDDQPRVRGVGQDRRPADHSPGLAGRYQGDGCADPTDEGTRPDVVELRVCAAAALLALSVST